MDIIARGAWRNIRYIPKSRIDPVQGDPVQGYYFPAFDDRLPKGHGTYGPDTPKRSK